MCHVLVLSYLVNNKICLKKITKQNTFIWPILLFKIVSFYFNYFQVYNIIVGKALIKAISSYLHEDPDLWKLTVQI